MGQHPKTVGDVVDGLANTPSSTPDVQADPVKTATATRQRIREISKTSKLETRFVEGRFFIERFLHRMTRNPRWSEHFVLKGSMLLVDLCGAMLRPTQDFDAHLERPLTPAEVETCIREVAATAPELEDGVIFLVDKVATETIVEGHVPGLRAAFRAHWADDARNTFPMKVDLAWGDRPMAPVMRTLPPVIPLPKGHAPVTLRCYAWEQVLAEKIHALARHGLDTTRMKDVFDLIMLARRAGLDGPQSAEAIRVTFESWGRPKLTAEIDVLADRDIFLRIAEPHWKRFLAAKNGVLEAPPRLADAMDEVEPLIRPILVAAAAGTSPDGGWDTESRTWTASGSSPPPPGSGR